MTVIVEEGAYIDTLYVSGDNCNIIINGEVGRIIIMNDAEGTNITVGENGVVDEIITGAGGGGGGGNGQTSKTNAAVPSVTMPGDMLVVNSTPTTLTPAVTVSDNGTLTYQWYEGTTPAFADAAAIQSETGLSYTPPTNVNGIFYYFFVAKNTNNAATGNKTATKTSGPVIVTVRPAQEDAAVTDVASTTGVVAAATKSVSVLSGLTSVSPEIFSTDNITVTDENSTAYTAIVSAGIIFDSKTTTEIRSYLTTQIAAAINTGVTIGSLYDISVQVSSSGGSQYTITATLTAKTVGSVTAVIDQISVGGITISKDTAQTTSGTDGNIKASTTFTLTAPSSLGILNFTFMTLPYSIELISANAGSDADFAATMMQFINSLGGYTCTVNTAELTVTANTAVHGQQITLSIP